MKKTIIPIMLSAGMSATAVAGVSPFPEGNLYCNGYGPTKDEVEGCFNGEKWELELKCEGGWQGEAFYDVEGEDGAIVFGQNSETDENCIEATLLGNIFGEDSAYKHELKCESTPEGKKGDKIEFEAKHYWDDECASD
ncbi:MAG: hypothetical protein ACU83O_11005 [Gammaproteobacteria bacterium]